MKEYIKRKIEDGSIALRERERCKSIQYRLAKQLRVRVYHALRGRGTKSEKTLELLGCDIETFQKHLESKFKIGMSWENYGKWHVDHIVPCISFDLSKLEEQRKCFNYLNLQPLWAEENLKKSSKLQYDSIHN